MSGLTSLQKISNFPSSQLQFFEPSSILKRSMKRIIDAVSVLFAKIKLSYANAQFKRELKKDLALLTHSENVMPLEEMKKRFLLIARSFFGFGRPLADNPKVRGILEKAGQEAYKKNWTYKDKFFYAIKYPKDFYGDWYGNFYANAGWGTFDRFPKPAKQAFIEILKLRIDSL
jgi:hypothetical protein